MERNLTQYHTVITEIKSIISTGQEAAYNASNKAMLFTYWNIGKRIVEQELRGGERAEYGSGLISALAEELTKEFGKNYSKRNLHYYIKFYQYFPDEQIVNACVHNLNWTHIRNLLRVSDENARYWYMKEAVDENWSSRTLDRNISTQYYYRLLQTPKKAAVIEEMKQKTAQFQKNQFELIKSPVIAEFLGFKNEDTYLEGDLDYLDLVFYNIELKCYVLIDLKMGRITHQDVGQIDMYVRMYDDLKRGQGDNPTIGILLCSETDEDIARYSVLHDNDRLFMSKYLTYLPTKEQLKTEIERQKEIFFMQHPTLQTDEKRTDE